MQFLINKTVETTCILMKYIHISLQLSFLFINKESELDPIKIKPNQVKKKNI